MIKTSVDPKLGQLILYLYLVYCFKILIKILFKISLVVVASV